MYTKNQNIDISISSQETQSMVKTFMSNVFGWMFIALAATAATSYLFIPNVPMLYGETGMSATGWIVMLLPFGFVLLMNMGYQRLSVGVLTLLFIVFAVLMGMSLSVIFLIYTASSIFQTFIVAALMFGVMAVAGYTTKTDLTKFGSLMMMGVVGLVIASVINMFMGSSTMDYIISFIGVLVFTGLTAYDVQKLKRIGMGAEYGSNTTRKLVILGALNLYLDFINLFLFLLRFLGNRS